MKERLALPEPHSLGDINIGSDYLLDYLGVLDNSVFRGKVTFDPTLDLPTIEPFLRELHETEQIKHVYSQEVRDKFNGFDLESIEDPYLRKIEMERRKFWEKEMNNQQPVERSRSIYYKPKDEKLYISPIIHGEYSETYVDTFDLFEAGYNPLFEIHSHPNNSLFSPQDYYSMILNDTESGRYRTVKGAIVVCPDVQIMALATPETLFLEFDEVDDFMKKFHIDTSDIGIQVNEIIQQMTDLIDKPYLYLKKSYIEINNTLCKEKNYYEKGLYVKNELNRVSNSIIKTYKANAIKFMLNNEKNFLEEFFPLKDEKEKLLNQFCLEVAREVRPQLFMATDFRHFKAFSI